MLFRSMFSMDAANRLRVSQVSELGMYKIMNSNFNSLLLGNVGTATFTLSANKYNMAVTSGQYGIIYSYAYHTYHNGQSQLIEMTTANMGSATNVEKSIGYISSDATGTYNTGLDGFRLFKDTSNNYAIEVWRNGTRIINHTQSNWTIYKMNGTESAINNYNINTNNFQWFGFDFLYLGGTKIDCYAVINGNITLFTQIPYAGSSNADDKPIFNSPNKPVRYEIRSTTGSSNMDFICSLDRKSTRLNSSHSQQSRMPSSA